MFFGPQKVITGWARVTRDALPTELLPGLVGEIGLEPMTDNPMSSAHQSESGQGAKVDVDCRSIRLSYFHRRGRADLNRQPTVPITHNLRPAENGSAIVNL